MRGRIIKLEGEAKLEIWADDVVKRDMGGYCFICEKYLYSIRDLVRHFVEKHEHESMEKDEFEKEIRKTTREMLKKMMGG